MAIACLRLLTFLPERPLFKVPCFRLCIARFTLDCAFLPYLRAMIAPSRDSGRRARSPGQWKKRQTVCQTIGSALFCPFFLQELLRPLQLAPARRRQIVAGPVDEKLHHANPRADAFGADLLTRHDLGDRLCVLGEHVSRRKRRDGLHLVRPTFLRLPCHDCSPPRRKAKSAGRVPMTEGRPDECAWRVSAVILYCMKERRQKGWP